MSSVEQDLLRAADTGQHSHSMSRDRVSRTCQPTLSTVSRSSREHRARMWEESRERSRLL